MTEDHYVAWVHYHNDSISTCDSDADNAFKVYRWPQRDCYMPTMDEAYRFMKSNPLTSADMLREIQTVPSCPLVGCQIIGPHEHKIGGPGQEK